MKRFNENERQPREDIGTDDNEGLYSNCVPTVETNEAQEVILDVPVYVEPIPTMETCEVEAVSTVQSAGEPPVETATVATWEDEATDEATQSAKREPHSRGRSWLGWKTNNGMVGHG